MDRATLVRSAVDAASTAAAARGIRPADPVVLQVSNNVVVWLAPHPVIAKVGIQRHRAEALQRECQVCADLAAAGAPVGTPLGGLELDERSGLPVSFWQRLRTVPGDLSNRQLAATLRRVHRALAAYSGDLPNYNAALDLARQTLADEDQMHELPPTDRELLRVAFDTFDRTTTQDPSAARPLHGEPHAGNFVLTEAGPYLVDFETASVGPVEWDLASLAPAVAASYGPVDVELLEQLRLLNSARVATWCWSLPDHPVQRAAGEHHLAVVRRALA